MCSTPVTPKPKEIKDILLWDTAEYKMEEFLSVDGGTSSGDIVSRKRIIFEQVEDSAAGNDTLFYYRMQVKNWDDEKDVEFEKYYWMKYTESSIEYKTTEEQKSIKFFLLKVTSRVSEQDGFFKTLTSLQLDRPEWTEDRGDFSFTRQITGQQNVEYRDKLEECWVVKEEVFHNTNLLADGTYWYGSSGLLKSRQKWMGLDKRNSLGASEGGYQVVRTFTLQ